MLDCAVTVCEGAGTVLAWEPGLVQGIGAIMTGVLETSPMREVVSYVREHGGEPLDSSSARIDQVSGVEKAISMGFKRIAVTVIGPMAEDVARLRELGAENPGVEIAIFSTCNTLVRPEQAEVLREADVVCASASEHVRAIVGPRAIMQMGVSIPVFMMTELGEDPRPLVSHGRQGQPSGLQGEDALHRGGKTARLAQGGHEIRETLKAT